MGGPSDVSDHRDEKGKTALNESLRGVRKKNLGVTWAGWVVIISGIVILTMIVKTNLFTDDGFNSSGAHAAAQIKNFKTGIVAYKMQYDRLPKKLEEIAPFMDPPEIPKDPWGNAYQYKVEGDEYIITCFGADGRPGGEGLDSDILSEATRAKN